MSLAGQPRAGLNGSRSLLFLKTENLAHENVAARQVQPTKPVTKPFKRDVGDYDN